MSPENPEKNHALQQEQEKAAREKQEQDELAEYWLKQMAAEPQPKPPELTEKERAVVELNELFEIWLTPEVLEKLNGISTEAQALARLNPNATETEKQLSQFRKDANTALGEIQKRLKILGEPDDLMQKRKLLSRAVGMINKGLVDHTR